MLYLTPFRIILRTPSKKRPLEINLRSLEINLLRVKGEMRSP